MENLSQPDKTNFNEEEALQKEKEMFLLCCGSCLNFIHFMAEAGFCKIAECNCVCKNPKAMIDMFDDKCDKWIINPIY
jgi:hypothetical protein